MNYSQSYQHDFQTAFSFFYEAYDALVSLKDSRSLQALKYMVLMRILSGKVMECSGDEVVDVRNAGDFSES